MEPKDSDVVPTLDDDLDLDPDDENIVDPSDIDFSPDEDDDSELSLTPISADSVTINPKVDEEPLDLQCPDCGEVIEGVHGNGAEYHCGCEQLRCFRIRGSGGEDDAN